MLFPFLDFWSNADVVSAVLFGFLTIDAEFHGSFVSVVSSVKRQTMNIVTATVPPIQ